MRRIKYSLTQKYVVMQISLLHLINSKGFIVYSVVWFWLCKLHKVLPPYLFCSPVLFLPVCSSTSIDTLLLLTVLICQALALVLVSYVFLETFCFTTHYSEAIYMYFRSLKGALHSLRWCLQLELDQLCITWFSGKILCFLSTDIKTMEWIPTAVC